MRRKFYFNYKEFLRSFLIRQIAPAAVPSPTTPIIVAPRLTPWMSKRTPLAEAKIDRTIITDLRIFDIESFFQSVRNNASGPPYIAGETIIATINAKDSMVHPRTEI
ncbi:MAG: hypothetical protein ACKOEB_07640 [Actinomycetota bacterium]